jgi:hypothetical protein
MSYDYYLPRMPEDPVVVLYRSTVNGHTDYVVLSPDEGPIQGDTPVMECRRSVAFNLIYIYRASKYRNLLRQPICKALFN